MKKKKRKLSQVTGYSSIENQLIRSISTEKPPQSPHARFPFKEPKRLKENKRKEDDTPKEPKREKGNRVKCAIKLKRRQDYLLDK
uniref:Uncharacterized protein n=1 Tax=Rhizophora mucronata TaxID=61149 RepID=A0A2P2R4P7_RHIMU